MPPTVEPAGPGPYDRGMEPERGQPEPEPAPEEEPGPLAPPGDLRPAQAGVLLESHLTLGHLGATLIDLVQRGQLAMEQTPGLDAVADLYDYEPVRQEDQGGLSAPGSPDWVLTDRREPNTKPTGYYYESLLLDSLFAGPSPLRLSELTADTVRGLGRVQAALLEDMHQWRWLGSTDTYVGRLPGRGREVRRTVWAFRRELRDRFRAGQDVSALAQWVALFELAPEPDPRVTAWLDACDQYRDPEYAVPGRPLGDEPVEVFYLNWVSPPGYERFHRYEYLGPDDDGADQHRWGPPRAWAPRRMRLVRWLRAAWRATRRE